MKRIINVLFALAAVISTTSTVYAQAGCNNATLSANYAFSDAGFGNFHPSLKGPTVPISAVGVLTFDGAGNISFSTLTLVVNGGISSETGSGSYTVNSDCTGSISLTSGSIAGITFNMVVIGGGTEVFGVLTSPGNTQTFDAKKQ